MDILCYVDGCTSICYSVYMTGKTRIKRSDIQDINKRLLNSETLNNIAKTYGYYEGYSLYRAILSLGAIRRPSTFDFPDNEQ